MATPEFIARLRTKIGHALIFVPTVVVIVRDGAGRVLLVLDRDAGQWTLPGGIVEPEETPANAAVRELWEETGARVELTRLVGVVGGPGCTGSYANGDRLGWVATVFGARVVGGTPGADGVEIVEARYFDDAGLGGLRLSRHVQRFLDAERRAGDGAFFEPATWVP